MRWREDSQPARCRFHPVKAFRFYLREPVVPPSRDAAEMSAGERLRLRVSFQQSRDRLRRRIGAFFCCILIAGIATFCIGKAVGREAAIFPVIVLLFAFAIVTMILLPHPRCPACENNLETISRFCPECGL